MAIIRVLRPHLLIVKRFVRLLSTTIFHMPLTLGEGERHGYTLKREILQRTGGKLNLGSGGLYCSIN